MSFSVRVVSFVAAAKEESGDDEPPLEEAVAKLSLEPPLEEAVAQLPPPRPVPSFRTLLDAFHSEPLAVSMTLARPGKRELGELTWVRVRACRARAVRAAHTLWLCVVRPDCML